MFATRLFFNLTAAWSRVDLTYQTPSPWLGMPITAMAIDLPRDYEVAAANIPTTVDRINPVGLAWNASFAAGIADTNPYDLNNCVRLESARRHR